MVWTNEYHALRRNAFWECNETLPADPYAWIEDRIEDDIVTYILYYHDETCFHKNEHRGRGWHSDDVHPMLPKSDGAGFNVSDYISAWDGAMKFGGERVRVVHAIGSDARRHQYYWKSEHMVEQAKRASRMHQRIFKLNTDRRRSLVVAVFCYDHALCHKKRPENALGTHKLNVGPGLIDSNCVF